MDLAAIVSIQDFLSQHPEVEAITYNHRASCGKDNTYSTQLNYGISHQAAEIFSDFSDSYNKAFFCHSIVNAGLLTGGGKLDQAEILFSQKMEGLEGIKGRWSNRGTIFQVPYKRGQRSTLQRVEVRLADSHPGEWADFLQAGMGGIIVTVAQLSQSQLEKRFGSPLTDHVLISQAKAQNRTSVDAAGLLHATQGLGNAVDWTTRLAETFLGLPLQGVKGEAELVLAAEEVISYCDIFRQVLSGKTTIHALAEKGATWAKRVAYALAETSLKSGMVNFAHPQCKSANDAFDLVRVESSNVVYGPAFAPENIPTAWRLTERQILEAMAGPPADTVAALRTRIIREQKDNVAAMSWGQIDIWQPDGTLKTVYTNDPLTFS